jgi:hypothetical protein
MADCWIKCFFCKNYLVITYERRKTAAIKAINVIIYINGRLGSLERFLFCLDGLIVNVFGTGGAE